MSKIALTLFLIACIVCLIVWFVYGLAATIFPFMILFGFLFFFGVLTLGASVQADVTPGLERLEEPSICFSRIYNAWLYVNDREGWALYVSIMSCILGAVFGTIFGSLISSYFRVSLSVYTPSWLAGMFLTLTVAALILTSNHWSKTEENPRSIAKCNRCYNEGQSGFSFLKTFLNALTMNTT